MDKAWEDLKRTAQSALDDIANSYQDILIRGHLLPSRNLDMWIAESEYDREHAPKPEPKTELFYLNHFYGKEPPEPQPVEPEV
jgi:hypothetical protein